MNRPQLRTLLSRSTSRLYSTPASSSSGSKVVPTFLLLTGGTAAGLGGYYYYDPNAELFKQAKSLIGVDNQAQPKLKANESKNLFQQKKSSSSSATDEQQKSKKSVTADGTSNSSKKVIPSSNSSNVVPPPPLPHHQQKADTPTQQQQKSASSSSSSVPNPSSSSKSSSSSSSSIPVVASTAAAAIPGSIVNSSSGNAAAGKSTEPGGDAVPKQVLVTALRAQQEALIESHEAKLKTLQKEYGRKLDNAQKVSEADRVVELRGKYEKASAALSAIEKGIEARADQNARAKRLRALWAQVNALHARVNHPEYHGTTITVIDKKSLQQAIEVPDKFVNQMLDSLPSHPVHSLESLKQRFYNELEPVAKNVSLIKEGEGFSLLKYACGKVLSWGVVDVNRKDNPAKDDKPQSTTQVLDVARGSLEKGDLLSAAVAVNKLNGLPRQVATDWLADARALLETNQTLFALMTYAASNNVF